MFCDGNFLSVVVDLQVGKHTIPNMARILVIDDESSILNMLKVLLSVEGYQVTAYQEATKALEVVCQEEFDLVITDLRMAPISGMDVLKYVREQRPALPVIIMTAYGKVETAIESFQIGAFEYLKKPFKAADLLSTVRKALEMNASQQNG